MTNTLVNIDRLDIKVEVKPTIGEAMIFKTWVIVEESKCEKRINLALVWH